MSFATVLYTIILYPLVQLIALSFKLFDKIFDNTGIAVIGVSFTVTLLCLPLYIVAEKWQQIERDTQARLKNGVDRIKSTFKGDEQYMILSTFYKQNHYHPMMALRSSFGLLIQIPFFMAAYSCLSNLPALQGQSFLFIKDMGQPDAITIGKITVNILPIAMTLINIIAGAIYTKGFPLKEKIQIYGMAIIFLVLLYTSPAGLVLYWTMNNILSLVKNIFYKLKNPVKTFYYCVAFCCIIGILFFVFVYNTKTANKLIISTLLIFILLTPLYVKLFLKLLNTRLSFAQENKTARHSLFLASITLLLILTGLSIPTTLIASSPSEFCGIGNHTSPSFIFINTFLQAFGIFIFWTSCIYFLFGKKVQTLIAVFLAFFALGAIADTFIFQGKYGDISSTLTFLNITDFKTLGLKSIFNIIFLIALFIGLCFFAFEKKGKPLFFVINLLSLALVVTAIPSFSYINKEVKNYIANAKTKSETTIEPIFNLSKNGKNIILIFLDRAQSQFVPEILNEDTSFNETFSGFVNYPQTLSFNGHTIMGAPGMFAGYEYTPYEMNKRSEIPLVQKNNEALLLLPRIFTEQLGFSATITDPSWANYNTFIDTSIADSYENINAYKTIGSYNDLWYKKHSESDMFDNAEKIIKRNMLYFCFFREVPICFRELIYYHGTYWNSEEDLNSVSTVVDNYAPLEFLPELTAITDPGKGSYTSITNELTHTGFFMQYPEYVPAKNVEDFSGSKFSKNTAYHTQMASFKQLAKWFNFMKEQGVYDNTRIIIVSDHGGSSKEDVFEKNDELDNQVRGAKYSGRGHYHCLLMFKDFYATGNVKTDNTFMTNADTPSLLLSNLGATFYNPYTNKEIPLNTNEFKTDGIYLSASDAHQPLYNGKYKFSIKDNEWWHVKENIFEAKNWIQESPND